MSFVDAQYPGGIYFSFKKCTQKIIDEVLLRLSKRPTIAHNAQFEQWMTFSATGKYANIKYDTAALINQIEGDSMFEFMDGLKPMQTKLLSWEAQGDVELARWLVQNGYLRKAVPAKLLARMGGWGTLDWSVLDTEELSKVLKCADKGSMCKAPDYILGHYCNLDAQATWLLYTEVYAPVLERFPELDVYHSRDFQNLIKLIDEARRSGISVAEQKLLRYAYSRTRESEELLTEFFEDSPATPHIEEYNNIILREHYDRMPDKVTKTGKPSKKYENWNIKLESLKGVQHFNPNSKKQLGWLFYDALYNTEFTWKLKRDRRGQVRTDKNGKVRKSCEITVEDGQVFKWDTDPTTNRESVPTRKCDKDILPKLGEAGMILAKYNLLSTELSYISSMLESLEDGVHHTQLKVSGTKTDRCSGTGGVNIQQLPKSIGYLSCLQAKFEHALIQMDVDALEPVVIAELSGCKSYMKLYGPGRPPNDVYLFIASQISIFKEEVRNAGYDPDNPTAEGIKSAKKKCKRIRSICKVIHLSAGYGAGAPKIHESLRGQGIQITLPEVTRIREMYWQVFEGVTAYGERLKTEHTANKGYVLDGLGTPVTVHRDFLKDIINRTIQRTGHMILTKYNYHLSCIREEKKLKDLVPMVPDFHDETIWQAPATKAHRYLIHFNEAWSRVNEELGGVIPLSGEPMVCHSFAAFKCED